MINNIDKIEKKLNYNFKNYNLLKIALSHPSYTNEHNVDKLDSYQRLEFLGDSILNFIVSEYLYNNFLDYDEGKLTKIRSKIVCENSLSNVALNLKINEHIFLGKGSLKLNFNNTSILADVIEAIIAAIYLDGGMINSKEFINNNILSNKELFNNENDYKTIIHEYANSKNIKIKYEVQNEVGPEHAKEFYINLYFNDKIVGGGMGKSKKEAEQNAAKSALFKIKEEI